MLEALLRGMSDPRRWSPARRSACTCRCRRGRSGSSWLRRRHADQLASPAGYALLGDASGRVAGATQALAAGAILVMLVDAMVRDGGTTVGLITVLGFAVAVLISQA